MSYNKYIFDVGANNGIDGLAMAINNHDCYVHAFEPNLKLCNKIKKLKIKLEKRKGIKIKNYKIHNLAVSNKKGVSTLNISINDTVSSLNKLSKNLDRYWSGYKETVFKIKQKVKVKTITLFDFMKEKKISHINYLHIDTQGHDLKVLEGLKNKINYVYLGKLEASISKKVSAYLNNHTIKEVKEKLKKTNLKIYKISKIDHLSKAGILNNEVDIFYKNKIKKNHNLNLNYNTRYYRRILGDRTYIKDDIVDFLFYFINKIFLIWQRK